MKWRPIIMTADSVRAILDGRKRQTRRVMKPQPDEEGGAPIAVGIGHPEIADRDGELQPGKPTFAAWWEDHHVRSRFAPGDRLWVKETIDVPEEEDVTYRADGANVDMDKGRAWAKLHHKRLSLRCGTLSCLYMPRWACRLALEVLAVRVERVQAISKEDALGEGLSKWCKDGSLWKWSPALRHVSGELDFTWRWQDMPRSHSEAFARAWDQINAKRGFPWSSNPWCWVIEFNRLGADAMKELRQTA